MPTLMIAALQRILDDNRDWRNSLTLRLFINDRVPAPTDDVADYTEATFPGYSAQAMTGWGLATILAPGRAESLDDLHEWVCTAEPGTPQSVFGSYWTDGSGNLVRAARRSTGPLPVHANVIYQIQPRVVEENAPPC